MSWFVAGAVVSASATALQMYGQARAGVQAGNAASAAEAAALERTVIADGVRNAYNASLMQMQLASKAREAVRMDVGINNAAALAVGDVRARDAVNQSIGASTKAVVADVHQQAGDALAEVSAAYDTEVQNYNRELRMMVLNSKYGYNGIPRNEYVGPGAFDIAGAAALSGLNSFVSTYGVSRMTLGLGDGD